VQEEVFSHGPTLSAAQWLELCKPDTSGKVKEAMFTISDKKSKVQMGSPVAFLERIGILPETL